MINAAKTLFNNYERELNSIDKNLKENIQEDKRREIKKAYQGPITRAKDELESERKALEVQINELTDHQKQLVCQVVDLSEKTTAADAALASMVPNMPDHLLEGLVNKTRVPLVKLAILNRSIADGDVKLKKTVTNSIQLPVSSIRSTAQRAAEIGKILAYAPGSIPEDRLTYGHRLKKLEPYLN